MSHLPKFTRRKMYRVTVGANWQSPITLTRVTATSERDALRSFRSAGGYRAAMRDGYTPKMITAKEC